MLAPMPGRWAPVSVAGVSMSEEIRASAAAHRDLGPGYDTAIAEGLVERIGQEIDRRIDARLNGAALYGGQPRPVPPLAAPPAPAPVPSPPPARVTGGPGFFSVVLALGSMAFALGATIAIVHPGDGNHIGAGAPLILLIWGAVVAVNYFYARHRS